MSPSPRLMFAAAALLSLTAAAVIHVIPQAGPQAHRTLFAPPRPPATPAPLALPSPTASKGSAWLPPVLRSPGEMWALLKRDTAATTRGQIRLVQLLEDTVRDQVRSLLQHPLGGA